MIDVVNLSDILAELQQIRDYGVEVRRFENALLERRREIQLDVELQASDLCEIVFARVEKHAFEERRCRLQCRWIARTEFPIDFDQGLLRRLDRILPKRLAQHNTDVVALRKEHMDLRHACIDD